MQGKERIQKKTFRGIMISLLCPSITGGPYQLSERAHFDRQPPLSIESNQPELPKSAVNIKAP